MDLDADRPAVAYRVRVSDRARHARLQVSPRDGLVVVVPRRFNPARIPALVESRADWISRALARVEFDDRPVVLPDELDLPALGERWPVDYRPGSTGNGRATMRGGRLVVTASGTEARAEVLRRFVSRRVRVVLGPELDRLAAERGHTVRALSIRGQRTRWASCSSTGRISLNRNLAFLPRPLVEAVLLHELCHLEELNHSPSFWALLSEAVPDLAVKRAALRDGWRHVPRWSC